MYVCMTHTRTVCAWCRRSDPASCPSPPALHPPTHTPHTRKHNNQHTSATHNSQHTRTNNKSTHNGQTATFDANKVSSTGSEHTTQHTQQRTTLMEREGCTTPNSRHHTLPWWCCVARRVHPHREAPVERGGGGQGAFRLCMGDVFVCFLFCRCVLWVVMVFVGVCGVESLVLCIPHVP